tara:strand:+ start:2646 stop:2963 length:318 start_codon:yes stop_codon:yes gene_type:complete
MQTKESLETNISHRETEVSDYQVNVDNYTTMLKVIPNELPEELEQHRYHDVTELVLVLTEKQLLVLSDVQFHAKIAGSLLMEKMEQRKAQFVMDSMKVQLEELCI